MKKNIITISLALCTALAANPISIERIVVNENIENQESLFLADENLSLADNKVRFSTKSISILSTHAKMNPYSILAYSPSVHFTPVDAAGTNEPSFHDPIRIRGKSQSGPGGVYMINSMPLSSNPGGGKQMLDMENIASIDLLKGYLSVDKNLGFSSLIGKVDMKVLAPKKDASATISQSLGRDHFSRTFLRFDTGNVGDFAAFGSFSYLTNNKHKGDGDTQRVNAMVGFSYKPNDIFQAELYAIRNSDEHHNYDSLSYAQTKDLKNNYKKDFATHKPTSANDVNYYDWNKQDFTTTNIFADIKIAPTSDDTIKIKPYYKKDKGEYWFTKSNSNPTQNRVINWQMDHDLYGVVTSYKHKFSQELKSKIGYWYHKQLPPGPPSDQRKYKVDTNGNLEFDGFGILADNDYHVLQAPFVEFSGEISNFVYSVGVQYQTFKLGSIEAHKAKTYKASTDYDTALANTAIDYDSSVSSKTFKTWMPSLYLGYKLDKNSAVYVDYSRSYGFDVNLFPSYSGNANLQAKVKLQQLWDDLEIETSDNIDLGYKTMVGGISLHPSLFISFVKNKQANAYNPTIGSAYPANLGDAFGYGAEFSASGAISESLEFMTGLSYNHYSFSENFQTSPTASSNIKGNQLPDAPKVMAKGALSYYLGDWTFTPSVRYTSSRYGNVDNSHKVDAYTLVDFDISYEAQKFLGSEKTIFRATATNLTNEKYISTIITADNVLAASQSASTYQTGTPFGLFFSATLSY